MIISMPDKKQLEEWQAIWRQYRDILKPDRKSGSQLIDYLTALYDLEPVDDPEIAEILSCNIRENSHWAQKLPEGAMPDVKAFYVCQSGNGCRLYENRTEIEMEAERVLVLVDLVSGCFQVEGSERLWDELCGYQGVDAADLENYVCTAMYVQCREMRDRIIGSRVMVTVDRSLGSRHPKHNDMIYPVNYGYVSGILAPDGDWQDAYILGVDHPVEQFCGRIAAVVHRRDDVEDKWVVLPENMFLAREQIEAQIDFQERYFDGYIVM